MAQIYASKTNEIQKYETEHENEVRHLAGECMVLLENDGVLPFRLSTASMTFSKTNPCCMR